MMSILPEPAAKEFLELREKVQKAIGSDWNLKTFKGVYFEIMRIINDPKSGAKELARVISMDPGLTARTLRIINSPYYALTTKVTSLTQAVVLLGFEMLKQIALSISVFEAFPPGAKGYLTRLWRNSLGVAKVAETLAKERGRLAGEAYTLGLIHHIGKILLCTFKEKKYFETLSHARKYNVPDVEAEREVLGVDHTEIGSVAAVQWELPPLVAEVILSHHTEYTGGHLNDPQYLAQVLLLADKLCSHLGLGPVEGPVIVRGEQLVEMIPPLLYENLGFNKEAVLSILGQVAYLMREIDELLNLLQIS